MSPGLVVRCRSYVFGNAGNEYALRLRRNPQIPCGYLAPPLRVRQVRVGHLIVGVAVELATPSLRAYAAPLLEEECRAGGARLLADVPNPTSLYGPVLRPGLAAADDPVYAFEIEG